MAKDLLTRVRSICHALPDTEESDRLGGTHFYVRGKIFAGCGDDEGGWRLGVKVGLELQSILITRPGFHVAKYVGKHGWISVEEGALQGDEEMRTLVQRSYELIAAGAPKAKAGKAKRAAKGPAATKAKRATKATSVSQAKRGKRESGKAAAPAGKAKPVAKRRARR